MQEVSVVKEIVNSNQEALNINGIIDVALHTITKDQEQDQLHLNLQIPRHQAQAQTPMNQGALKGNAEGEIHLPDHQIIEKRRLIQNRENWKKN